MRLFAYLVIAVIIGIVFSGVRDMIMSYSQPRDFLMRVPVYEQTRSDLANYCGDHNCSQEQVDLFIKKRDKVLKKTWPDLVIYLTDTRRWQKHYVPGKGNGYAIRDDFYRIVEEVGGVEALKRCTPVVSWYITGGGYVYHSFAGVKCDDKEYKLMF